MKLHRGCVFRRLGTLYSAEKTVNGAQVSWEQIKSGKKIERDVKIPHPNALFHGSMCYTVKPVLKGAHSKTITLVAFASQKPCDILLL